MVTNDLLGSIREQLTRDADRLLVVIHKERTLVARIKMEEALKHMLEANRNLSDAVDVIKEQCEQACSSLRDGD